MLSSFSYVACSPVDDVEADGDRGSLTAMRVVVLSAIPNFLYDSPMLLLGERRKTSSEWGVRVLARLVRWACRARKVAERRWWGVSICENVH
jgi:hypothetical protein